MSRIITLPNFLILLKPSPLGCLGDIQGFYDSTPRPCRCPICELTHLDRAGQRQGFFPPVSLFLNLRLGHIVQFLKI